MRSDVAFIRQAFAVPAPPLKLSSAGSQAISPAAAMTGSPWARLDGPSRPLSTTMNSRTSTFRGIPPHPTLSPHREREERFAQLLRINREVERGRLAGRGVTDLQQQLLSEERITLISGCSGEVELRRQDRTVRRFYFDVNMWRPPWVLPGHHSQQRVPAGTVGDLVTAQPVPRGVVCTLSVRLPEIQPRAHHRPAPSGENLTGDGEFCPRRAPGPAVSRPPGPSPSRHWLETVTGLLDRMVQTPGSSFRVGSLALHLPPPAQPTAPGPARSPSR